MSEERLSQLPDSDGASVIDDLSVKETEPVNIEDIVDDANNESHLFDEATVPNIVAEEANLDQFRQQIST